jgi:hypothetical protein
MAWKARLQSVPATNDVTDSFFVELEFHDDATSRSFVQSHKIVASGETLQETKAVILAKVAALTSLDNKKATLLGLVGTDIE